MKPIFFVSILIVGFVTSAYSYASNLSLNVIFQDQIHAGEDITEYKEGFITGDKNGQIHYFTLAPQTHQILFKGKGRPLGVAVNPKNDDILYVTDAKLGLIKIQLSTQKLEVLIPLNDPFFGIKLPDDLVLSQNNVIYFTNASSKYFLDEPFQHDIMLGSPHGQILSYDLNSRETKSLLDGLVFPNGITLSYDEKWLYFTETGKCALKKLHLESGRLELVYEFDGHPDNIYYDFDNNQLWVAIYSQKSEILEALKQWPQLIKLLTFIPIRWLPHPKEEVRLVAFKDDVFEKEVILQNELHFLPTTSVVRKNNQLILGSLKASGVGIIELE